MRGVAAYTAVDDPSIPWVRRVETVDARLVVDRWPAQSCATVLRGAVCEEMARQTAGQLHVDWHNHTDDDVRQASPRVMYRVHDGPHVYMWGERAAEHVSLLMRGLHALRLPRGEVVEVRGVDVTRADTDVRVHKSSWYAYELTSPLFPPDVSGRRMPNGDARLAWAGQLLERCIMSWYSDIGLDTDHASQRLHVHMYDMRTVQLEWRKSTGQLDRGLGFVGRFLTSAILPDGIGLGKHRSVGFGEVRRCGV